MIVYRWLRAVTRGAVALLTVLPALTLLLAVLVDRGAQGQLRDPGFPLALFASDPFAWTCARNSLIYATSLTALSLIGGVGLGWMIARRRFWGRGVLRTAIAAMLAAPPACMALGLLGLFGSPRPWPWPWSSRDVGTGSVSLETWSGRPLWMFWLWTTLPSAVALVALATATALERVQPAWFDAARLAGAGRLRAWYGVTWPLIRPSAVRAAALVFPMALFEPGVPLLLGLRRTLPFQIVEAAGRAEPFPRIAVWTVMAAAIAFSGRVVLRWWAGPILLAPTRSDGEPAHSGSPLPRASAPLALVCTATLAGATILGWLPILGLVRPFLGSVPYSGSSASSYAEIARRAVASPVPQVLVHSGLLGLEVGGVVLILAWLLRPDPGGRQATTLGSRVVGRFAQMPPLAQGVGLLALPGLISTLAVGSMGHLPAPTKWLSRLDGLAHDMDVGRNPWGILTAAVGLSVGARLLRGFRRAAEREPDESRSGLAASLLAAPSRRRARRVAALQPGRWIGAFLLATSLAAINLAPALLFSPWMDRRTLGPAMLVLADRTDDARLQAAALALVAIGASLFGLGAARLAASPPPEWDTDPA